MSIERLLTGHGIVRSLDQTSAQPSLLSFQHSAQPSTLSHHHFVDISTELLRHGYSVRFRAPGRSMHPTIKEGETITVVPVVPFDVKRGDILLYLVGRMVIAHRIVSIERKKSGVMTQSSKLSPHHLILLRGDASGTCDKPVEAHQVLGKVTSVKRGDFTISLYSRKARMLRFVHVWVFRLKRWMIRYFLQVKRCFH